MDMSVNVSERTVRGPTAKDLGDLHEVMDHFSRDDIYFIGGSEERFCP